MIEKSAATTTPQLSADELESRVTNAGRWGVDDQVGTLNHVTPAHTAAAAASVRSGRVVSAAHNLNFGATPQKPRPLMHRMLWRESGTSATDMMMIEPHGYEVTHVDALSHISWKGLTYNDRPWSEVLSRDGLTFGDVAPLGCGVATRGVLLDVAASQKKTWLDRDAEVTPADLERAEEWAGVKVGTGDVLVVRVGLEARERVSGPEAPDLRAGLDANCVLWMQEREVAAFGGDCMERFPSTHPELDSPLHQLGLARMGLVLIDNIAVEDLAIACSEEKRWDFFFTAAALRIPGATGSPVNPLCIF